MGVLILRSVPAGSAPVNTSAPVVSGTARVGSTLSCSTGSWNNEPASYAYQWKYVGGGAISGATSSTYEAQEEDIGEEIYCTVTATNAGGVATADSNAVGPVEEASEEAFDYYIGPSGSDSNAGTESSPWAITAINTKRATIAGKRVGLLDGTYSTAGIGSGGAPALDIGGGSEGSPTVIQAVNPRMAIIDGGGSATRGAIGSFRSDTAYITLKNLVVQNNTATGVHFQGPDGNAAGIRVEGCEIHDQTYDVGDITAGIFLQSLDDAVVHNCYIHDVNNTAQAISEAGTIMYGCRRTEITENTFTDLNTAIYDKYAGGSPGNRIDMQETRVRRNYFLSVSNALLGFDNKDQTGPPPNNPPYGPYIIENNVFEGCGDILTNPGAFSAASPVIFRNNTIYRASGSMSGANLHTMAAGCEPSFYNNIVHNAGTWTGWRALTISLSSGVAAIGVIDYNCYGPSSMACQTYSVLGYPYAAGGSYSVITSLSSWRAATGQESASVIDNAEFTLTGSGADRFQLGGGSPCIGSGRVGGVSGGAACNMGAWDGVVTQIGCGFAED